MRKLYPLYLVIFLILSGWMVQYVPGEPTDSNIKKACEIFNQEGIYPQVGDRILDNYTDAAMLMVSKSGIMEAGFKRFLFSPIYIVVNNDVSKDNIQSVYGLCRGSVPKVEDSYARYWHGYQVILRPLLYFTNYQNIRLINKILQPLLFILILGLFYKRKAYGLIPAWIVSYIILSPIAMSLNMGYSIIYYIFSFALLLILIFNEKIEKNIGWGIFFIMIGICVGFFDFLTYPIASLAIPLTVLMYINPPESFVNMLKQLTILVLLWGIGYVGMWSLKWVMASIFTEKNVIEDAFQQILFRATETSYEKHIPFYGSIWATFIVLFEDYITTIVVYMIGVISLFTVLVNDEKCFKFAKKKLLSAVAFCDYFFKCCCMVFAG